MTCGARGHESACWRPPRGQGAVVLFLPGASGAGMPQPPLGLPRLGSLLTGSSHVSDSCPTRSLCGASGEMLGGGFRCPGPGRHVGQQSPTGTTRAFLDLPRPSGEDVTSLQGCAFAGARDTEPCTPQPTCSRGRSKPAPRGAGPSFFPGRRFHLPEKTLRYKHWHHSWLRSCLALLWPGSLSEQRQALLPVPASQEGRGAGGGGPQADGGRAACCAASQTLGGGLGRKQACMTVVRVASRPHFRLFRRMHCRVGCLLKFPAWPREAPLHPLCLSASRGHRGPGFTQPGERWGGVRDLLPCRVMMQRGHAHGAPVGAREGPAPSPCLHCRC